MPLDQLVKIRILYPQLQQGPHRVDPIDVMLLMRHTPPGGMALTLGVYGDQDALLTRKRLAIARMVAWIETQQKKAKAASG